jgi:hypothetical protein
MMPRFSSIKRIGRWNRKTALLIVAGVLLIVPGWRIVGKARVLATLNNNFKFEMDDGFYHYVGVDLNEIDALVDDRGIRIYDYEGDIGRQHNPVTISQFVLSLVANRENEHAKELLFKNLDFLIETAETTDDGNIVFPYHFDFPICDEQAPWYSGMAQGLAASAFLWGYRLSSDEKYLVSAKQAILALREKSYGFLKPLQRGCWVKEFPNYRLTVLDGSLAAIAGIYDLTRSLDDSDPDKASIQELLDRCVIGFKSNSQVFDSPRAGHYFDDAFTLPTPGYHRSNLAWLAYLATYDGDLHEIHKKYSASSNFFTNTVVAGKYYLDKTPEKLGLLNREARIR